MENNTDLTQVLAMLAQGQQQLTAQMTAMQQPQTSNWNGHTITAEDAADIAEHEAKLAAKVEEHHNSIRKQVKDSGKVASIWDMLDGFDLNYEQSASFASNAMYNARRSAYSIRAGVERQEEYQARIMQAPVTNPALSTAETHQNEQQQIDAMSRMESAEQQKNLYFAFESVLIECIGKLQVVLDQNARQGMGSIEGDTDTEFVSEATLRFLQNTPAMSEPDYIKWREEQESRRARNNSAQQAATKASVRANTALYNVK